MATLDAFFNRIEQPAGVSTVEQQKCESSLHNEKNAKDAFCKRSRDSKRVRDSDSADQLRRLQNKRQKSLDSNLNISNCSTIEVDSAAEIVSCSEVEVEDNSVIYIPSSAVEISYEEFLSGTGIAHIDTSLCDSEDAETDVKMSPGKTSLKHGGLTDDTLIKGLKKDESSIDEDECEGDSNSSEVASKDIRSFFSKADKVSTQPVTAATLMKIKVDVHCQQSQKNSVSSKSKCTEGHAKAGNELARRQRAAIVITDDDLDIEVIDVSQNDDFEIEFLQDNIIDGVTSESNADSHMFDSKPENTSLMCSEVLLDIDDRKKSSGEHNSVPVETSTSVAKAVDTGRKRRLRTAKLKEDNDMVDAEVIEKAVSCKQVVDGEHGKAQLHKGKCSDKVIVVDEKDDTVECADSSTTESANASLQSDATLATESRKPKQASIFRFYFVLKWNFEIFGILSPGCLCVCMSMYSNNDRF